jgi:hypothetical protein
LIVEGFVFYKDFQDKAYSSQDIPEVLFDYNTSYPQEALVNCMFTVF